jgi:hypothetical protein
VVDQAKFALLYRTPKEWRISVRTPEELACGALSETPPSSSFETAAREFEQLLRTEWNVTGSLAWEELKPDWWGVDLMPGALRMAGERPD